jgi:phosphoglycolate phosphatase
MNVMGKPLWSVEQAREWVRLGLRESFLRLFGDRWQEVHNIYLDRFQAIHLERLTPFPGREAMLRALADNAVYLAVVSNKTGAVLRAEAAHLGWLSLFGCIVGAGDAIADKPACAPVELALQSSGVRPSADVWFVGDAPIDMECADASGCVPVLLGCAQPSEEFAQFPPRLTFPDGAALLRWFEGL